MSRIKDRTNGNGDKKLNKLDWLKYGLEALRNYGVRGLNVEPLAEFIGVTKGSFYWHFKDRKDFYKCLVQYWEEELTTILIDRVKALPVKADERLKALMFIVLKEEAGRYESDIRAWAAIDEIPEKAVARVDKYRLLYVESLFLEMGFSKKEAKVRGRIFYLFIVGEFMVFAENKDRTKYLNEKFKFFTAR